MQLNSPINFEKKFKIEKKISISYFELKKKYRIDTYL